MSECASELKLVITDIRMPRMNGAELTTEYALTIQKSRCCASRLTATLYLQMVTTSSPSLHAQGSVSYGAGCFRGPHRLVTGYECFR